MAVVVIIVKGNLPLLLDFRYHCGETIHYWKNIIPESGISNNISFFTEREKVIKPIRQKQISHTYGGIEISNCASDSREKDGKEKRETLKSFSYILGLTIL